MNCVWIKEQTYLLNKKLILNGWVVCSKSHNVNVLSLKDVLTSSVNIGFGRISFLLYVGNKYFIRQSLFFNLFFLMILSLKFKRLLLFLVHSQLL